MSMWFYFFYTHFERIKSSTKSLIYDILFIMRLAFKKFRKPKKYIEKKKCKTRSKVKRSCKIVRYKNNKKL